MMASMGPSFSPHPGGMQQHPGAPPGHPMAPGMAHTPSQQGAQPGGMPHQLVGHMGVSTPGGQMNPAAMMGGMTPGAGGPNAHAMQHLNPAQAQMFQAQQHLNPMAFASNPALQQQVQQHRLHQLAQQQQHRQLMAQQSAYGNMGNMPMGIQMQPMSAQAQMAAMRNRLPGQQPNSHTHPVMLAQQLALQQQQVANNQMAQQGGNPNPSQMNPQQMQGLQQAQMAAMQAQQQAQSQAAQAQAQPPTSQAQQPGQPQQQTPQQPQHQAGPGGNTPQNQGPGQGPNAQSNPQQQSQAPQTPQQTAMQQAQLAAHAQHQSAVLMQQKHREGLKGQCLLKLMQFGEHLSGFSGSRGKDDLSYWNDFVQLFFSPRGIFRHVVHIADDNDDQTEKQYEISYAALARYFHIHFHSGVKNMQLIMDKGTTDKPLPGDCHFIENTKASLVYWFEGGSHLVATGILRAHLDADQKFEFLEFVTTGHEEYISRSLVIQAAKPAHNWVKEWHKVNNQDNKQSPEMSKKGKPRPMKSPPNAPPDLDIPHSAVRRGLGITEGVFQFLEMVEIMGQMNPLFGFFHTRPALGPYDALEQYLNQIPAGGQNAVNGQPLPQAGQRTPSFGQFPVGASPAQAHQILPGSPHVSSPAQVQMQLQASQQGTSSSGPSANTSPSQSNKRRRPSAVKNEDEASGSAPTPSGGSTPQVNGIQSKGKPPTPRMPKRVKGNPA